jgi:hypothetical protein
METKRRKAERKVGREDLDELISDWSIPGYMEQQIHRWQR